MRQDTGVVPVYLVVAAALVFLLSAVGCVTALPPADDQPETRIWIQSSGDDGITYVPLGIEFPASFEHLVIGQETQYDDAGLDVSVGYNSAEPPFTFTFYCYLQEYYPHPTVFNHFEAVVGDVLRAHPGSEVLEAFSIGFTFGQVTVDGYLATFRYEGGVHPDGGGLALLLPYDEFYVYVRASFPGVSDQANVIEAHDLTSRFLIGLNLPDPPQPH